MRVLPVLGIVLLLGGIGLLAASVLSGEGQVYLLLFIPVYAGEGALGLLGVLAVFFGVFLAMAGFATPWGGHPLATPAPAETSAPAPGTPPAPGPTFGGVVMLGPIPIVFGSNPKITKWMLILGILLFGIAIAAWIVLAASLR